MWHMAKESFDIIEKSMLDTDLYVYLTFRGTCTTRDYRATRGQILIHATLVYLELDNSISRSEHVYVMH